MELLSTCCWEARVPSALRVAFSSLLCSLLPALVSILWWQALISGSCTCCSCAGPSWGAKALNGIRSDGRNTSLPLLSCSGFPATHRTAAEVRTAFCWRPGALQLHESVTATDSCICLLLVLGVVARLLWISCFHSPCLQSASALEPLWAMTASGQQGFHPESVLHEWFAQVITQSLASRFWSPFLRWSSDHG